MPLTPKDAVRFAEMLIDFFPVSGVKVGFGDFNKNGKPDAQLEVFFEDKAEPFVIGPIDIPGADLKSQLRLLAGVVG